MGTLLQFRVEYYECLQKQNVVIYVKCCCRVYLYQHYPLITLSKHFLNTTSEPTHPPTHTQTRHLQN